MTRCQFCPRSANDTLKGVYDVCNFCRSAFEEGFATGRLYESERKRTVYNPRRNGKRVKIKTVAVEQPSEPIQETD